MKKPVIVVLLVALILVLAPSTLMAKISGDPLQQYKTPFLLTSGGQGAGSKILRVYFDIELIFRLVSYLIYRLVL